MDFKIKLKILLFLIHLVDGFVSHKKNKCKNKIKIERVYT